MPFVGIVIYIYSADMKIIKKNLIDKIYLAVMKNFPNIKNLKKNEIQIIVDLFLETVVDELVRGNSIELRGFGIFERSIQKARMNAVDPRTRYYVDSYDYYKVSFKQGKKLRKTMRDIPLEH